jgi:hypothetical protein
MDFQDFLNLREPVSAWSHGAGLLLALPGTLFFWRRSARDRAKRLSLLVYGLSLAFCYLAWGRCSICCTGPSSFRESSRPMSCSTCSC